MISDDEILAIVGSELSDTNYNTSGGDYEKALDYYLGNPNGREVEGRSTVTSTDVADTIEWILPQIMKSFTQNNEIVIFDPVHEGDEIQAELESEYVYDTLMKKNDGFIVMHQMVKDALMQRNGILKVFYDESTEEREREYTGLTGEQVSMLLAPSNVELLEISEEPDLGASEAAGQMVMAYDVKVNTVETIKRINVESVAPENFRISSFHNSINADTSRFTAHVMLKTASDLKIMGVSDKDIAEMNEGFQYDERVYRFASQGEDNALNYSSVDDSQRLIEISECYMMIDVEGKGIATLNKVTVAGSESPTSVISVEAIDSMPWVTTTAFMMSHKFQGLSIYDRVKEIQDQKTSLWRNMFDNLYLQNNQRNIVLEGQVNMDDLLVSRPGGSIRAKRLDAITPLITPQIGDSAQQMMIYLDQVRAGRTGVDPDGSATPSNIGDRVGSQGVERLMNAKEELVGLIIRVIAETGIKPLMYKIRNEAIKHLDTVVDYRFRGQWQKINPAMWSQRDSCTVRVGTGTGNHNQQVSALQEVISLQERIMANPGQNITNPKKVFDTIDDFCKFSGLNGATRYFLDPASDEGQQAQQQSDQQQQEQQQQQQQMEQQMAEAQTQLANAEMEKARAQQANVQAKAQSDMAKNQLTLQKQASDSQIDQLTQQLDEAKLLLEAHGKDAELEFKYDQLEATTALELTRIKSTAEEANYGESKNEVETNV